MPSKLLQKYFRMDKLPHIWCPGCGHGIIMKSVVEAIDELGLEKDKVCIVSGIGCSSRAPGYMDFNTLHTTHGRALAFATGIKMANPELHVIVVTGDGDSAAIGGNHLIHAARRNIDITTVVFNNNIYGMTGGQYSPTTPTREKGTTAPYGNIDKNFDLCELAKASGATYTARATAYHAKMIKDLVVKGVKNKGFSFVESISICPTYYGRKNKKGESPDMMKYLKDNSINVKALNKLPKDDLKDKIVIGELYKNEEAEYTEEYQKIIEMFRQEV
ncbi:2-oxoacid:ferredoxin oxidoreductase subunit beta [Senegalia massiliensis]|uniref:2-oxoacid:ferredoxin oxidoreductase subunit beta n=1 Tax=Senegalia massiliensis TaxID=1720316 RepID=A0A845QWV8_9CLOT|nr:2-oxoacid:ferredoxin oxidoreductase subunit beta [Senegalia massiliensis]NBI06600.1 2-oxoacid:ferredoxin oxidoreductase subunit beta [Senegalia massiliensis]